MTLKEELVRRAAELVPVLRERAADTEGLRQIPQETVEDFHNADLLRVATPERFGGLGFEYDVTLDIALELGRGCTSAAWCYGIWANSGWVVGMYPEKAQQEYWADSSDTLSSGGFSPARADATPVDGGYRLSGQWDFCSGCDSATWALLGVMGEAGLSLLLVPKSDFTIEDTWHVSGLSGSGSKDIVVQDVFVPSYRALPMAEMAEARTPGRELNGTLGYRVPFWSSVPYALAAPIIGAAQGALEVFETSMASKISALRGGSVAEFSGLQVGLAEASVEIQLARLLMRHDIRETLDRASRNEMPSVEERIRYRRNQAYVVNLAVRAVNRLFDASGGHSLYSSDPLQRFHRDVHAASHHFTFSWHSASEQYGRVRLGLEPTVLRF